jgi:hypothetical protein
MTTNWVRARVKLLWAVSLVSCEPNAQHGPEQQAALQSPARTAAVPESAAQIAPCPLCEPETATATDTVWVSADTLDEAYRQFAAYLSLAVATRRPHMNVLDTVYTAGEELGVGEAENDMRWVAASRILSVRTMGDRAQGFAEITTVARQTSDTHDHWTARYAIREDTARWSLVRSADTGGRWKVWGDAYGGFGITQIGRDIVWAEGSRAKALAAVDSIRRARRLELLR